MFSPRAIVLSLMLCISSVAILADEVGTCGLVNVSAASLRTEPRHSAEMDTQVPYGTPIEVIEPGDTWSFVRLPDGVEAYIHNTAFAIKTPEEMVRWRRSPRLIVTAVNQQIVVADTLQCSVRNAVSDATLNAIFEGVKRPGASYAEVVLPDGRKGFLPSDAVDDFAAWADRVPSTRMVLDVAYSMMGTPYLWGGATTKAADCSGLTQLSYFAAGILLPRNASRQALTGQPIADFTNPDQLRPGDLLFFGEGDGEKVTHVAIYDSDSRYIHDSGSVFVASFDPNDELYIPRRVLSAVRLIGTDDFTPVIIAGHPWYF